MVTRSRATPAAAPRASTRDRIIDVAEQLFAERGIDAVSVRDIIAAAGANTAAIHYHFGSKQGLVEAILAQRAADVTARRERQLVALEARGDLDLRSVVVALVLSTSELAADNDDGAVHYLGFLTAVLAHPDYLPLVLESYEEGTDRFLAVLAMVTPGMSPDVREVRWAMARDLTNRVLGNPNGPIHQWLQRRAPGSEDTLEARLVDFLVGGFAAPA